MQPKNQPQENDNIGSVKTKSYLQQMQQQDTAVVNVITSSSLQGLRHLQKP